MPALDKGWGRAKEGELYPSKPSAGESMLHRGKILHFPLEAHGHSSPSLTHPLIRSVCGRQVGMD